MESLHINTGGVRLCINDDPNRVIEFNPQDLAFAERFYGLLGTFEAKEADYQARAKALQQNTKTDSLGIPTNFGDALALLHETCDFLRGKIDEAFGDGTSQTVFGEANTLDMFEQFFTGITPYVQKVRGQKVQKYTGKQKPGVLK
jgi:hypothetical protein